MTGLLDRTPVLLAKVVEGAGCCLDFYLHQVGGTMPPGIHLQDPCTAVLCSIRGRCGNWLSLLDRCCCMRVFRNWRLLPNRAIDGDQRIWRTGAAEAPVRKMYSHAARIAPFACTPTRSHAFSLFGVGMTAAFVRHPFFHVLMFGCWDFGDVLMLGC